MIKDHRYTFLVILLGFVLSIFISKNNLIKFDKNIIGTSPINNDQFVYHPMIKTDSYRYLSHGAEIKNQLENGVNFFKTGREGYTKYLPPRIAAAYYYFFDVDLFNNFDEKIINTGVHFPFLIIQCSLYFFSLLLLFFSLKKILSNKICFFIILFLSLEPTIFQYHGTFWSESIFFSIQILLVSLILDKDEKIFKFLLTGVFLAILSMQKQMAIVYIVPIIIYFLLSIKEFKIKKIIVIFFGFFIVQSFLGYNNYQRSGSFYIMTADTKIDVHKYLVEKVMGKKLKVSPNKFMIIEGEAVHDWIITNSINYNEDKLPDLKKPTYIEYRNALTYEKDKVNFDNFIRDRTFMYIFQNPLDFGYFIFKAAIHSALLNPFHIYSDHNFLSGEIYYESTTHDKLIPYRVIYTLLIYTVCVFGIFYCLQNRKYNILLYLTLSIIYFYGLISWHGDTRYFVPVMIYLSFFFGFGMDKITNLLAK